MQFIPATQKAYPHDHTNPLASIDAAGQYFQDLIKQYKGNVMAAVAHYNGGGAAGKAVANNQAPPSAETQNYMKRVAAFMRNQEGR